MNMTVSSDLPIERPDEDLFGLDPFAKAIAKSIEKTAAPSGAVLAVNGPWGSGKSSAVNLILHHLKPAIENGEFVPVRFNPWWFAGSEPLTLAFFQQLSLAVGPSLGDQMRDSIGALGQQISAGGPLLAALANFIAPGAGAVVGPGAGLLGRLTGGGKTVEQEHAAITKALAEQTKKFLVIVDDIDRLSPDDALTIFRLVKSVGRLPNVIYLLSFDRDLAERAVSERFPSEGRSYLDKIVQTSFEVPPPPVDELRTQLLNAAVGVFGAPTERQGVRFMNVFYDVVASRIRTPRDVVRILNDLRSTWPAVEGEVDRADFFALTAIRVNSPALFRAIRDNPDNLCGLQRREARGREAQQRYDSMLGLDGLSDSDRELQRQGLRRLFPRLDTVWSNMIHSDDDGLRRERRIASKEHFRTYFAFALPEEVLSVAEIESLIAGADDREFVRERLRRELAQKRPNGSTRASLLLDELVLRASEVPESKVATLTATLFEMADELDVESDEARGFAIGNNSLRIHWLMNRLVTDRFDEARRTEIYSAAMDSASLHWCCDFAERCLRGFKPTEDGRERSEALVPEEVANRFGQLALTKLRQAAASGELVAHRDMSSLLFEWRRLAGDDGVEVKAWTHKSLANSAFVVAMARAIPTVGWSQGMGFDGMGDRVARRTVSVKLAVFETILDTAKFEARVTELLGEKDLTEEHRAALVNYREAPRREHD